MSDDQARPVRKLGARPATPPPAESHVFSPDEDQAGYSPTSSTSLDSNADVIILPQIKLDMNNKQHRQIKRALKESGIIKSRQYSSIMRQAMAVMFGLAPLAALPNLRGPQMAWANETWADSFNQQEPASHEQPEWSEPAVSAYSQPPTSHEQVEEEAVEDINSLDLDEASLRMWRSTANMSFQDWGGSSS